MLPVLLLITVVAAQGLLTNPWPPQAVVHDGAEFDFVVVGAGSAGCVVAARLAQASFDVLVVEAGGDPPVESIIPGYRGSLTGSQYDWNFTTENDHFSSQALKDKIQRQVRGKMLGGTGSMNDMVYARGYPGDYNEWVEAGNPGWSWPEVLPYFKKSENLIDPVINKNEELMNYHGNNGSITVVGYDTTTKTIEHLIDAFVELGFDHVQDMTYPHKYGVGTFTHTILDGRRDSSATAYLNKAGKKLSVLKQTQAIKILLDENSRAVGIQCADNENKVIRIYAKLEVIISAGAFNSPKLLMLSGIGPKSHLESLGIGVASDLPVGYNLHDHPMVPIYFKVDEGTCAQDTKRSHISNLYYIYNQTGPLSRSDSMAAYFSIPYDKDVPDFAIYPSCIQRNSATFEGGCSRLLGLSDELCSTFASINTNHELISLPVVLLKPLSRGKVELRSENYTDAPFIYSGSFSNFEDLDFIAEGIMQALNIVNTKRLWSLNAEVIQVDLPGCENLKSDSIEYWSCYALNTVCAAWHSVGTCSMGPEGVVNPDLEVHNIRDLRVVDASVMPVIVRGNTNAPTVMIAEKIADVIINKYDVNRF